MAGLSSLPEYLAIEAVQVNSSRKKEFQFFGYLQNNMFPQIYALISASFLELLSDSLLLHAGLLLP